ncbi:Uroporphyrinogen decarboxylase (URO-D) [Acetitomaculum ruminis DSM 5522]|uniref:Uroporphyrinogen decarboxylase (URO-D) n=1 Tax=Acetitomaculum ruminis DSM 5522 TaxID=1120918 RepID=A0A1I1A8I7_9FIRM|nr:uroporphyrinogen decarboxylase family protein [Acetitomaculum ruminis]SFB32760.1 Uroporphyrinogen decarboxylase (URO-D) [Acetitomaculum ruminis DSM 5522]
MGKFMETAAHRDYSKWWQKEGTWPAMFQMAKPPITGRPYSVKENYIRCVKGEEPYWMPAYFTESNIIWPDAMEEHPVPEEDGYDWWGVNWQMVDSVGGMITKPGTRTISDFANWKEELEWPDLSLVDFKADGAKIQQNLDPDRVHIYECVEGLFERLHEMIPFDESLVAFYEEPELLAEFFEKMADYKIESCSKIFEYYGRVDGVLYHDDWGTQRSGFFSNEMFDEQIMPETSRFLKFVKDQGKFIELHSCGKNIQYVPEMIEMGIDMWNPQLFINEPDLLHSKYGKQMTFAFPLTIEHGWGEEEIRKATRDFVDHFGENGRVMAFIMTDMSDPKQGEIAHDELYNYSLEYYNKLYGRK